MAKVSRLFISFSGGETSGYMTQWCLANWASLYDEIAVLFANTGQERNETLDFVKQCDDYFNLGVVWVEAEVHHGERKSNSHRVVTHETASRQGRPFEDSIKKYGIPNAKFKQCTRDLKLNPMQSYIRDELGWKNGTYDTAIGIRVDEIDRISSQKAKRRIVYPLIRDNPMSKPEINLFWSQMPFRLQLKGYEGNCAWCWKKSLRKHMTLLNERPDIYDFPERMERKYGLVGPEFEKAPPPPDGYRRTFFRGNLSVDDLRAMAASKEFTPAEDDADVYPEQRLFGFDIDRNDGGCSEHCEVFHDHDDIEQGDGENQ